MNKIPVELDTLLWSVVDSGDPQAIEEFGERYPHLRAEAGKRLALVRNFKGSRPTVGVPDRHFAAYPQRQTRPSMRFGWALAAVGCAALVFASAKVAMDLANKTEPLPKVEPIVVNDPTAEKDGVTVDRRYIYVEAPKDPNRVNALGGPALYEIPANFEIDGEDIVTTLQVLAAKFGIDLEIAPNMPKIDVTVSYAQLPPIEMMKQMGAEFGFTLFEQERGHVLIVPEIDPNTQPGASEPATEPTFDTGAEPIAPSKESNSKATSEGF